jgi:hypothetical protein
MREHMSSSPLSSPPHHDMPFVDADRASSGRVRHMSGRRHSLARVEEEVRYSYAASVPFSSLCRVPGYEFCYESTFTNSQCVAVARLQSLKTFKSLPAIGPLL